MIPNDPLMLLSYVNTALRDQYPSLKALCQDQGLDAADIREKLASLDYTYDAALNRFV